MKKLLWTVLGVASIATIPLLARAAGQPIPGVDIIAKCNGPKPPCPKRPSSIKATYQTNGDFLLKGLTAGATYGIYTNSGKRLITTVTAKSNTLTGRVRLEIDETSASASIQNSSVTISGGFETDSRDGGRPVVLIASMLGVAPEVFREAFSHVTPAKTGEPTEAEAQSNKTALLTALSPYGVTNEKLDTVSNYYRYMASKGETWAHIQARVEAVIENGKVVGFKVANAGSGYSSPPKISITYGGVTYEGVATLKYTQDFSSNGSISAVTLKK